MITIRQLLPAPSNCFLHACPSHGKGKIVAIAFSGDGWQHFEISES